MKKKLKSRRSTTGPSWYNPGPDRRTRALFAKHGKALRKALSSRMERKALGSGRPWKYKAGRDFHTGLKRLLLRLIATIREAAR